MSLVLDFASHLQQQTQPRGPWPPRCWAARQGVPHSLHVLCQRCGFQFARACFVCSGLVLSFLIQVYYSRTLASGAGERDRPCNAAPVVTFSFLGMRRRGGRVITQTCDEPNRNVCAQRIVTAISFTITPSHSKSGMPPCQVCVVKIFCLRQASSGWALSPSWHCTHAHWVPGPKKKGLYPCANLFFFFFFLADAKFIPAQEIRRLSS